jgi:hypothetical protein
LIRVPGVPGVPRGYVGCEGPSGGSVQSRATATGVTSLPSAGGRRSTASARRSRKSFAAIPRREFVTRDPWRSNRQQRCMPRWQALGSGTTRGASGRVRAADDFPPCVAGHRPRVGSGRRDVTPRCRASISYGRDARPEGLLRDGDEARPR